MNLKELRVRSLIGKKIVDVLLDNGYIFKEINENSGEVILNFTPESERYDNKALILKKGDILVIRKELFVFAPDKVKNELFLELLKVNTEILPISVAVNINEKKEFVFILNESLHMQNLDVSEFITVFETIENYIKRVVEIIEKYK